MIQHSLRTGGVLIKYETLIQDNASNADSNQYDNHIKEAIFTEYLNLVIDSDQLAVQVYQELNPNVKIGELFHHATQAEGEYGWEKWEKAFKSKSKTYIYFYKPSQDRMVKLFEGYIDKAPSVRPSYIEDLTKNKSIVMAGMENPAEALQIENYHVEQGKFLRTLSIKLNPKDIYNALLSAQSTEYNEIIHDFEKFYSYKILSNKIPDKKEVNNLKRKL